MLKTGETTIEDLFRGQHFFIPKYQRYYSWTEENYKQFLDDLLDIYKSNNSYFYGTLLLMFINKNDYEIVDGQQRITTLYIFLKILIDSLSDINNKNHYLDLYIKSKDSNGNEYHKLTVQEEEFFLNLIDNNRRNSQDTNSKKNYCNAYDYFYNKIQSFSDNDKVKIINKINDTKILLYIVIDECDATGVFETNNNRGRSLSNIDKIKNFLLHILYKKTENFSSDREYLLNYNDKFSSMFKDIAILDDDVAEDSVLQYSYIANNNWTEKEDYQNIVDSIKTLMLETKIDDLKDTIMNYVNNLKEDFDNAVEIYTNKNFIEFKELKYIRHIANFMPLLLKTYKYDTSKEKENFKDILHLCLIFSYRVWNIGNIRSNAGQSKIFRLAREFNGDFTTLKDNIIERMKRYCDDDTFLKCFEANDFYEKYNSNEKNYLFYKYENYLREKSYFQPLPIEDLFNNNESTKFTIEHIVAQNNIEEQRIITKKLQLRINTDDDKFKKEYLHSIGNLTLDPKSSNSSKGKKDVEDKTKEYFVYAPLMCQNELIDYNVGENTNEWTIESINKRKENILKFIKETFII